MTSSYPNQHNRAYPRRHHWGSVPRKSRFRSLRSPTSRSGKVEHVQEHSTGLHTDSCDIDTMDYNKTGIKNIGRWQDWYEEQEVATRLIRGAGPKAKLQPVMLPASTGEVSHAWPDTGFVHSIMDVTQPLTSVLLTHHSPKRKLMYSTSQVMAWKPYKMIRMKWEMRRHISKENMALKAA